MKEFIQSDPGIYAVELYLREIIQLEVGQLGVFTFPRGEYIYVGSAFGPGGLKARMGRHIGGEIDKVHWHIDYLSPFTKVRAFCYLPVCTTDVGKKSLREQKLLECRWVNIIFTKFNPAIPAPGFGASDCFSGCKAHLAAFPLYDKRLEFESNLLAENSLQDELARSVGVHRSTLRIEP